uniref:C2H2-type domain-containing protein n=1 Tax=Gasterosteus aculeatus aculeatus TaxID=481459 RepID=G3PP71_GASAC|nr:pinin [Gasterosteus aculeatus aculeatus]
MLFCEKPKWRKTDCKGASVHDDMWAGKCCCASTRVFPAEPPSRTREAEREQQQPEEPIPAAAGTSRPTPGAGSDCFYTVCRRGDRAVSCCTPKHENERTGNMNGAVYISFFQGQLESVLEQVVQLAVQEISKTVGSSLNTLLLEAAGKEQENHRLRLRLQAWENRGCGRNEAGDERTKPDRRRPLQQQQQQQLHGPGGHGPQPGVHADVRRLEQRGRVVDQLKGVMEQVLDFAVHELTKIVEASFDDLLLEITKMEREQQDLGETLDREAGGDKGRGGAGGRRRGSENDSVSPSGSEDTREELSELSGSKEAPRRDDPERPPVLSVSQDWVPILDKVFGQKWCSDVWQIKDLERGRGGGGGQVQDDGGADQVAPLSTPLVNLEPSPSSPQQDPRWTPLEDMEVFSPDEEATDGQRRTSRPGPHPGAKPGPPHTPTGRRSSASMLHRLLTLPSQLLDEEDQATKETVAVLPADESTERACRVGPSPTEGEEEEGEEEEEDKGRKRKRRRVWSECEECGRRFSRISLLKSHRLTHGASSSALLGSASSSALLGSASSALRCSACGKRFSSVTRLHSHVRTQHPEDRS